ncbi:MAG: amidase [Alphaproteobacteria bacterium]
MSVLDLPLHEIAAALRAGRLSAGALLDEAVARHHRFGDYLHAYRLWDEAAARAEATAADAAFAAGIDTGPLQGIPVSVKDIFGVGGTQTFAGSPRPLPARFEAEGPLIRALRRQLAVIVGKTHTMQFAMGGLGTNSHWGAPRNPWDAAHHRAPGGTSSGAGVSLIEGSALLAIGSDTGGSIRTPASFTATVGLKPTIGRWSTAGMVPLSPTLDTPAIAARSVADAAFAFAALDPGAGDAPRPRPEIVPVDPRRLRIGVPGAPFWDDASPGVAEAVRAALDRLAKAGALVEEVALPEAAEAAALWLKGGLAAPEFQSYLSAELPEWQAELDAITVAKLGDAARMTASEYLSRRRRVAALAASAAKRLGSYDVLAAPSVPITPPKLADLAEPERFFRANLLAQRNGSPINFLGLCAISLPGGRDAEAMPVGLQLIAAPHEETRLLGAALAAEQVLGAARDILGAPPLPAS